MAITEGTKITAGEEEFLVTSKLAAGGFGETYLAERTRPSPLTVVLKVPKIAATQDPVWRKKFDREARILANVKHANVVESIAFWNFADGDCVLVQEFVSDAVSLDKFVQSNPRHAASLCLQILYALRAFHGSEDSSVIHRDLSPSNILVNAAGLVKIIDFGLAKEQPRLTETLTATGQTFGTIGCMPPEQFADPRTMDHRGDLYAVGKSMAAGLQHRAPPFVDTAKLAAPWNVICGKLTSHSVEDRHQSAEEAISDAMEQFAAHQIPLENFRLHAKEVHRNGGDDFPTAWPRLCEQHFSMLPDLDMMDIELAATMPEAIFGRGFDARALFDRLEQSTALKNFSEGMVTFEDAVPLGQLYRRLYPHLEESRRSTCFRRLCKVAVDLHRYSVMFDVRRVFDAETDSTAKAALHQILDEEDPSRIIEGRGSIPGRDP